MRLAPWLAILLALVVAPAAAQQQRVEVTEFGLYAASEFRHLPAPEQLSGEHWVADNIRLTERTDVIHGQLGRIFGFRFRVHDPALVGKPLRLRIIHPPLKSHIGRSGTETSRADAATAVGQERGYFFAFEYTWEIAEGDWTFQVVHNGEVLAEKKFRVVVNIN